MPDKMTAWCWMTQYSYPIQCWPKSLKPCSITAQFTGPQWVKMVQPFHIISLPANEKLAKLSMATVMIFLFGSTLLAARFIVPKDWSGQFPPNKWDEFPAEGVVLSGASHWGSGPFYYDFSGRNSNLMVICFTVIPLFAMMLLQIFAHATAAVLSCHVQKFLWWLDY